MTVTVVTESYDGNTRVIGVYYDSSVATKIADQIETESPDSYVTCGTHTVLS